MRIHGEEQGEGVSAMRRDPMGEAPDGEEEPRLGQESRQDKEKKAVRE